MDWFEHPCHTAAESREDWKTVVIRAMRAANADDGRPRRTTRDAVQKKYK